MLKNLIVLVLVILALYGAREAWPLLAGPGIALSSPVDYASVPGGIVAIAGTTKRAAQLTLNGAPLLREENGGFSTTLTFPRGTSILTLVAADRFGRRVTVTRTLYVP